VDPSSGLDLKLVTREALEMDGDAYLAVRERFILLACTSDAERPIPACPAWTVRDLAAHLTGLCEDWVEGRLDGYASGAWTAAQVKRFRNRSVDDTIHRWDDSAKRLIRLEDDPVMGPPTGGPSAMRSSMRQTFAALSALSGCQTTRCC
jgi:hypothetical protein